MEKFAEPPQGEVPEGDSFFCHCEPRRGEAICYRLLRSLRSLAMTVVAVFLVSGCATTDMPSYLQPKKPYVKRYYSNYDKTLASVKSTLTELGWILEEANDPGVYEHTRFNDLDENQLLLVTAVRPTPMLVGTRYARMNIYLRSKKEVSEVEVRYLTTTSTALNNFSTYNNDSAVSRFFARLDEVLPPVNTAEFK